MGLEYKCKNCGYLWESRKKLGVPPFCPRCRSQDILLIKNFIDVLNAKIRDKFDKYLIEIKYDENSPYEYTFIIDDFDSKTMTKEELKDKLMLIVKDIANEVDPKIIVKIKLRSENGINADSNAKNSSGILNRANSERIARVGVKMDSSYRYFINEQGNIAREKNGKKEIVVRVGVKQQEGYEYFIDSNGDIARAKMKG